MSPISLADQKYDLSTLRKGSQISATTPALHDYRGVVEKDHSDKQHTFGTLPDNTIKPLFARAATMPLSVLNGKSAEKEAEENVRQTPRSHQKAAVEQQIASLESYLTKNVYHEGATEKATTAGYILSHEEQSIPLLPRSASAHALSTTSGNSEVKRQENQSNGTVAPVLGRAFSLKFDTDQFSSKIKATSAKNRQESVSSGSTYISTTPTGLTNERFLGPKSPYSSCTSYASQLYILSNIDENEPRSFFDWSGFEAGENLRPVAKLKHSYLKTKKKLRDHQSGHSSSDTQSLQPQEPENVVESLDIPALYFPTIYFNYELPYDDEVVHVRDERSNDYLVLEKIGDHVCITGGTIEFLVAELVSPNYSMKDPLSTNTPTGLSLVDDVISGITLGIGNFKLLDALYNQFSMTHARFRHRQRILKVVVKWIRSNPEAFLESRQMSELYMTLIAEAKANGFGVRARAMTRIFLEYESKYSEYCSSQSLRESDNPWSRVFPHAQKEVLPLDVKALELAQHFATLHLELFRDASDITALYAWWQKEGKNCEKSVGFKAEVDSDIQRRKAEKVEKLLRRNQMTQHWIAVEILQLETVSERAAALEKFIDTAGLLWIYGDLNGSYCIVKSLEPPVVAQLAKTWAAVSNYHKDALKRLQQKLHYDTVFMHTVRRAKGPVIPFFNAFLDSITEIYREKNYSHQLHKAASKQHRDVPVAACCGRYLSQKDVPGTEMIDVQKYRTVLSKIMLHRSSVLSNSFDFSSIYGAGSWNTVETEVEARTLLAWNLRFEAAGVYDPTSGPEHAGRVHALSVLQAHTGEWR